MGQKKSFKIILKKIGVFVMWATCLKKIDETGDVKRREGSGKALFQAVINNATDGFRSRVRLVIAENGQHIEKH